MIISHRHRYVFVELPRTGSSAIGRELRRHYDGARILRKHSSYHEFLSVATEDEKTYFVFSGIRNPLDDAVSRYFKMATDHKSRLSKGPKRERRRTLPELRDWFMWRIIMRRNLSFANFFRTFYWLPYDNWASESHGRFDYVIRFEYLADDFATVLRMLDIDPIRPLPLENPTAARTRDFSRYYTAGTIPRARFVFGPFMRRWGYEFPPSWNVQADSRVAEAVYRLLGPIRRLYWRAVRPRLGRR
jgi:hypothetical protein